MLLNRDLAHERELELLWREAAPTRVIDCQTLTGKDLKASNSFDKPDRVTPAPLDPPKAGARMTCKPPPRSYTLLRLATA